MKFRRHVVRTVGPESPARRTPKAGSRPSTAVPPRSTRWSPGQRLYGGSTEARTGGGTRTRHGGSGVAKIDKGYGNPLFAREADRGTLRSSAVVTEIMALAPRTVRARAAGSRTRPRKETPPAHIIEHRAISGPEDTVGAPSGVAFAFARAPSGQPGRLPTVSRYARHH